MGEGYVEVCVMIAIICSIVLLLRYGKTAG